MIVHWLAQAELHLRSLCLGRDRRPGSLANRASTSYAAGVLRQHGRDVDMPEFDVIGWAGNSGVLVVGGQQVRVHTSPYALGVDATGPMVIAASIEELAKRDLSGAIV